MPATSYATTAQEALRYAIASGCALLCDGTLLWVLVHFCSWNTVAAATLSFAAGTLVAYMLSVKLVFKHRRLQDQRAEFASFAALGAAGLIVNAAVIFITVKYWGLYYLAAKGIAAAFTLVCNFITRRQLLFVQRAAPAQPTYVRRR